MRVDMLITFFVGLVLIGFRVALTANWRNLSQVLADKMPFWWGGGKRWWWRLGGPPTIFFGLAAVTIGVGGLLR
jgi:hypothetical protein